VPFTPGNGPAINKMKIHYPFTVQSYETDLQRQMKPFALQCRLQELAYLASEAGGASYAGMRRSGYFWVLNRIHIVIDEWPRWGDELTLSSWFRARTGPMYQRHFVLHRNDDPDVEPLVKATSSWTIIALENRGVIREMVYPEGFAEEEDLLPFCEKLLVPPGVELAPAGTHTATYSDLDSNGHVNNCFYPQWATDLLGLPYLTTHRLTDIQVGYYREIHPGERADFFLGHNPEADATSATWYVEGRVGDERSFVVRLRYEGM